MKQLNSLVAWCRAHGEHTRLACRLERPAQDTMIMKCACYIVSSLAQPLSAGRRNQHARRVRSPILAALTCLLLVSCMEQPEPAPQGPPPIVLPAHYLLLSPDDVEKLMQSTPTLGVLDVRDDHEIRDDHGWIAGAEPCSQLQGNKDKLAKLDRARPWLVYCAIGGRAELAAQTMAELGFEKVYLLKGGFIQWRTQGKPVVK